MKIDETIRFLIDELEGSSFTNDPRDPGGATKYGISLRWYSTVKRDADVNDIKNLTYVRAANLYKTYFYDQPRISQLPFPLSHTVFLFGVNIGVGRAIRILQRTINQLECGNVLKEDGIIGRKTLNTIGRYSSPKESFLLSCAYMNNVLVYYNTLYITKSWTRVFYVGWVNRVVKTFNYIKRLYCGL